MLNTKHIATEVQFIGPETDLIIQDIQNPIFEGKQIPFRAFRGLWSENSALYLAINFSDEHYVYAHKLEKEGHKHPWHGLYGQACYDYGPKHFQLELSAADSSWPGSLPGIPKDHEHLFFDHIAQIFGSLNFFDDIFIFLGKQNFAYAKTQRIFLETNKPRYEIMHNY